MSILARTTLPGGVEISTVRLPFDHARENGPPRWYETMVFGGPLNLEYERCETEAEAWEQHRAMVARVLAV